METPKKSLGQVVLTTVKMTNPAMDFAMEHRELAIFVGKNGTGKTFFLKMNFVITNVANAIVYSPRTPMTAIGQELLDGSFTDQKFDGKISQTYTSGAEVSLTLEEGQVKNVEWVGMEGIEEGTAVIFLSSEMRLFSSISSYLKVRKYKTKESSLLTASEMAKDFKIYDVMYIERLIGFCPINLEGSGALQFMQGFDEGIKASQFDVDLERGDFFLVTPEGKKYLSTYGNGHQAMINMGISQAVR